MSQHDLAAPQFFLTAPSTCPYLEGRRERKIFTQLVGPQAGRLNDVLTQGGFRRSQSIAYRPACEGCQACVSVRVIAGEHAPARSQRRVIARNRDLIGERLPANATSEHYALFRAYVTARHADGGMAEMSMHDFAQMVGETHIDTELIEYRRRGPDSLITGRGTGPLVALALTDRLRDGLSMVYSAFDPAERDRSLGTYLVLDHIARAKALGLPFVYLGYWVEGSRKMDYKARFRPQERLTPAGWARA